MKMTASCTLASALLALCLPVPAAAATRTLYAPPKGECAGYPRLSIGMAKGLCAGLVAGPTAENPQRKMMMPRSLLQLDDATWLVSDLGHWGTTNGAIWKLATHAGKPAELTVLVARLNLPHALALGKDGLVYVGEMGRIIRFDARAADPAKTIQPVVEGLPDNRLHENRHPLSKFVFAPDGALLVNVGAPSDQCVDAGGKALGKTCPQSELGERAASIRRYALKSPGTWSSEYTVYARGLRNSVALAVHPSGTILQGENSYDFDDRWSPFDEINLIEPGKNYGWPYCADISAPTPGWKSSGAMNCKSPAHTAPSLLLPPHAAPLDLLWYQGSMIPALKGKLLVSWHGYRMTGGRIAAFATDAKGVPIPNAGARYPVYGGQARAYGQAPAADAQILTPNWEQVDSVRPQGSPVGLAVARDGAIWVADDKAGTIIRIAADTAH
jgi:glucose/arabinose dehydrogenase